MPQDPWAGLPDKEDPWAGLPDQQESPGLLQQWNEHWLNQGLLPKATRAMGFEWDPANAANFYDDPSVDPTTRTQIPDWVPFVGGGTYSALGAGLLEGAGNVVSGLTSPLNLATMGTGAIANRALKTATTLPGLTEAAYTTAPQVANVARRATQALSAPVVASGAAKTAEGIRTGNYADAAFGIAEMAGGGAGLMTPKGPPVRPPNAAPIRTPEANQFAAQFDLPLNGPVQPPPAAPPIPEFMPVDAPTAAPITPQFNQPAVPEPAPVNPLRPEIPEGQLTNRAIADALVNRSLQEGGPVAEPAGVGPAMPHEFAPPEITSTPGGEFVDPNTGEIKSAADAIPGDIVLPPGPVQAPQAAAPVIPKTPRRARNMILSQEGRTEAPTTFKGWLDELAKDESGTFDPENLSENLRNRIRDLGLDFIDIQQLPNSIYYYNRTGQHDIVNYLLDHRLWPNFRNMSREEIDPHLQWYVRQGNQEIATYLNEKVNERDYAAAVNPPVEPTTSHTGGEHDFPSSPLDEPLAADRDLEDWEPDRGREAEFRNLRAAGGRTTPSTPEGPITRRLREGAERVRRGQFREPEVGESLDDYMANAQREGAEIPEPYMPDATPEGEISRGELHFDDMVDHINQMSREEVTDFVNRNQDHPAYQTEHGQKLMRLARSRTHPDYRNYAGRDVRFDADNNTYWDRGTWDDINDATPEEQMRARGISEGHYPDPGHRDLPVGTNLDDLPNSMLEDLIIRIANERNSGITSGRSRQQRQAEEILQRRAGQSRTRTAARTDEIELEDSWPAPSNAWEHQADDLARQFNEGTITESEYTSRLEALGPNPAQAEGRFNRGSTSARSSGESYQSIADQIRGMTIREAHDYINEAANDLYPEDIQPMLSELNLNPTASTRAAVSRLEQIRQELESQGIRTTPSTTSDLPGPYGSPRVVRPGKTLEQVEGGKQKGALERLGRMIGEERAGQLVSGEREIQSGLRRGTSRKRMDDYTIKSWGRWAEDTIRDYVDDNPNQPGKEVITGTPYNPNAKTVKVLYRNEQGKGIGYLEGDEQGIWTLAVDPNIGLRRGAVTFELVKEAFDRGINEPAGSTSDLTKNLIDRVKRLVERAKRTAGDESGELVISESVIKAINDFIDKIADSRLGVMAKKAGRKIGEFIKDESGSSDADLGLEKLKEFFRRVQRGEKLTESETNEAKLLAKMAKANEPPITETPASMQNPPFETSGAIPPGGEPPASSGGSRPRRGRTRGGYQYGPTREPELGPVMPGFPERLHTKGTIHPENLPWDTESMPPSHGPRVRERQFGPTREPQLGPRRPRQPFVERNPQIVQDLHNRIRQAFEAEVIRNRRPGNNVGPDAVNKLMEDYLKVAKDNPEHLDQGLIRQVLGANKALLTSWDLSAPGRQGKAFMLNKEFWKALPGMVKAWKSAGAADLIKQSIIDHPSGYFKRGINQAGKPMKSLAEVVGLDIAPVEEMFVNTRTPTAFNRRTGIERSSRAHTAFLSKLRADMFVKFMEAGKALGMNPETNLALAKSYATFINNATGRGSLNVGKWKLNKVANEINDAFFAARNMSGQVRTWNQVLNPYKYATYDPVLRKQALKSLFALAGVGMLAGEVMKEFMGAKVSNDPTSSDFRKARFGDSRIDFFGGYGQFPIAAMKFISGTETPTSGEDAGVPQDLTKGGWRTRGSVAQRFLTNRLSPAGSFVWAWMNNREFDGKPFEVKRALYERTVPIAIKDMWELAQEDPGMALLLSPLIVSGVASTQTYTGGR